MKLWNKEKLKTLIHFAKTTDLKPGQNAVRCRIEGTYNRTPFVYEDPPGKGSQYLWFDTLTNKVDPSTFFWEEGNMSCDCNRCRFLPKDMDHDESCGDSIKIHRVIPLIDNAPDNWTLELDPLETLAQRKADKK